MPCCFASCVATSFNLVVLHSTTPYYFILWPIVSPCLVILLHVLWLVTSPCPIASFHVAPWCFPFPPYCFTLPCYFTSPSCFVLHHTLLLPFTPCYFTSPYYFLPHSAASSLALLLPNLSYCFMFSSTTIPSLLMFHFVATLCALPLVLALC
jgi:hypothetical protein